MVTRSELCTFIHERQLCVVSSVSADGMPEAALVNIAVTPDLELIFYTIQTDRKCVNLRENPRLAAVIGWEGVQTLQYEGVADEPRDEDLEECRKIYLSKFPERSARSFWPGLTFFRIRPVWLRFSSYGRQWYLQEYRFPAEPPPK